MDDSFRVLVFSIVHRKSVNRKSVNFFPFSIQLIKKSFFAKKNRNSLYYKVGKPIFSTFAGEFSDEKATTS